MKAYKLSANGIGKLPPIIKNGMYVHEYETAEKIVKFFKDITTDDCPLKWDIEEIEILSHAEVGYQLSDSLNLNDLSN